jgi:putative membrane protein
MLSVSDLPALNAALNSIAAVLIALGYYFIRVRRIDAHRRCMIAALLVSALFLVSYLTYHYFAGSVRYTKQDWTRPIYFFVLVTHILLAAAIVPLVLRTVYLGLRNRLAAHVRIARWTFPIWMYVSVTGVVVYVMLYRL